MIINSSNVSMTSSRKSSSVYRTETEEKRRQKGSKATTVNSSKDILTISDEAMEYLAKDRYTYKLHGNDRENKDAQNVFVDSNDEKEPNKSNNNNNVIDISDTISASQTSSKSDFEIESPESLKLKALLRILEAITGNKKSFKKLEDSLSKKTTDFSDIFRPITLRNGINVSQISSRLNNVWTVEKKESQFIKEEEVTNFSSTGFVKTADGRSISFNVNVEMSRSFEQYIENHTLSEEVVLQDPLVINLDSAPANISDQTFLFDIDADGKKEEISQLGKGSGFLALDKNGDGVINDGSELFGALSGNGFAELAQYDEDGNGWIDEADSIFNKLKVWTKDEKGNSVLLSLKEADLGAIYLKSVSTEFSVNDSETNEKNAQVRSTGVYLKESGGSGSIQQIDLAIKR